ncbi:nucleotide exchange factor GrpE [Verrucomicrobiaceae bacterium N1E253]|uniref:Protein GrpE n=2 Tax=Oceaniferula marina TaxID=2748318 RepID=A0A851GHX7_9BACT|nr:nucleotide exchange factor GrpE [Oceaniferula marina]
MQEPMQDKQETEIEENAAEEQVVDDAVEAGEEAQDTETVEEEELDPWEQLELEVAKWKDQAVRTAAELDNYRKRMTREKLDSVRYGNQGLLEELLPVLDNFEMGMQAAAQEQGSMLFMGMDMVQKQLVEFLTSQNVTEIPAEVGGEFDPQQHEALSQEASEEIEPEKIVRVIRKGYRMGERLLRPSNVIVSLGQAAETETESE